MNGIRNYTNDPERINEYIKYINRDLLGHYIPLIIFAYITIYFGLSDIRFETAESRLGICIFSGLVLIILVFLSTIFTKNEKIIEEYNSLEIITDEETIQINNKRKNKTIKKYEIKNIKQDKNKIYIMENIFSKMVILKYLNNLDDFINTLNEITTIGSKKENYIIQFLPIAMYLLQKYIKHIEDIKMIVFYHIIFLCITIMSIINIAMEQHKKRYIVLAIAINIYIIVIGGRAFYEIIKHLGY